MHLGAQGFHPGLGGQLGGEVIGGLLLAHGALALYTTSAISIGGGFSLGGTGLGQIGAALGQIGSNAILLQGGQ